MGKNHLNAKRLSECIWCMRLATNVHTSNATRAINFGCENYLNRGDLFYSNANCRQREKWEKIACQNKIKCVASKATKN